MKRFIAFIKKEFLHVFRDRKSLLMLFGLPIAQIILFGFALTNEINHAKILIVDQAKDRASAEIIQKIAASKYFEITEYNADANSIDPEFKKGNVTLALVFPNHLYGDLLHNNNASVQVIADASDPNTATTLTNYIQSIISEYNQQMAPATTAGIRIIPQIRMLYNPELKAAPNFVPGVIALILMLVCVMMTSVSIVREKEMGTMEVLLVSPFRPLFVVLSKAVPYLVLSLINLAIILLLSVFLMDLPVKGSIVLLFAESTLFIITALSLGLLISTATASQEIAMLLSLMGMLLPTLLFSGFMFPIENMPWPLQLISHIIPARWFYIIVKSIMIKGLGLFAIWKETLILAGMAAFFLVVSIMKFKKRLE
jgi:ABC-2 type transport system permease protein